MSKFSAAFEIVELVKVFDIGAFKVKHLQMLYKANVKQLIDLVVPDVELFQLFKCLNSLYFFQFTPPNMQHTHIFEAGPDISET